MKIIDADKLHYKQVYIDTEKGPRPALVVFAKEIRKMPAIPQIKVQVDPVKPGHWEVVDGTEPRRYGCSVCKRLSWTEDNYCSYCGAKMDEVEDADT